MIGCWYVSANSSW